MPSFKELLPRRVGLRRAVFAVALIPVMACAPSMPPAAGSGSAEATLSYLGGIAISGIPGLGGLSGLSVSADGARWTAVADNGSLVTGQLRHDAAGRLTGVADVAVRMLGGLSASGSKSDRDAEALARRPDGSWLVAFEGEHRIMVYPAGRGGLTGAPRELETPAGFRQLPGNKGIEALAVFGDGAIIAIAEAKGGDGVTHPVWLRRHDTWRHKQYRTLPAFAPTDAAVLPDGDLLILERSFSLLAGFGARLVLVRRADMAGRAFTGTELGRLDPPVGMDNFEGIAVRTDARGDLVAYMVSDDNFFALQRTLLVQYRLHFPDSAAERS